MVGSKKDQLTRPETSIFLQFCHMT